MMVHVVRPTAIAGCSGVQNWVVADQCQVSRAAWSAGRREEQNASYMYRICVSIVHDARIAQW